MWCIAVKTRLAVRRCFPFPELERSVPLPPPRREGLPPLVPLRSPNLLPLVDLLARLEGLRALVRPTISSFARKDSLKVLSTSLKS